jgi:hypothetical protein
MGDDNMNEKKKKRGENPNRVWIYIGFGVAFLIALIVTLTLLGPSVGNVYSTIVTLEPIATVTP